MHIRPSALRYPEDAMRFFKAHCLTAITLKKSESTTYIPVDEAVRCQTSQQRLKEKP
jgi:hypothetical protein